MSALIEIPPVPSGCEFLGEHLGRLWLFNDSETGNTFSVHKSLPGDRREDVQRQIEEALARARAKFGEL